MPKEHKSKSSNVDIDDEQANEMKLLRDQFGPFEIQHHELTYIERIGSGVFGEVYKGTCRGVEVAIKKLKQQEFSPEVMEDFRHEVEVMRQVLHPHVVLFMGACFQKNNYAMVTELMKEGSVNNLIHSDDNKTKLTLADKLRIAKHTALAMRWLHGHNPVILHRDLKPANLLVDANWNVKICDLGLSTLVDPGHYYQDQSGSTGSPLWMAPEVMLGKNIDHKCDVYSFGIVLWEIMTGKEPFSHHTEYDKFVEAVTKLKERPDIPSDMHPAMVQLLQACWHDSPAARPDFGEVCAMLEKISVELMVDDVQGQKFWKENSKHFEEGEPRWNVFIKQFLRFLSLPDSLAESRAAACLKKLIATVKTTPHGEFATVPLESFGHFVDWFGPFDNQCLDRLEALASYNKKRNFLFHGNISSEVANQFLISQPRGTYLIRVSSSVKGQPFVISRVSKAQTGVNSAASTQINHNRVSYSASTKIYSVTYNGQNIVSAPGESLPSFIKTKIKKPFALDKLCPGSVFAEIYVETNLAGYQ